MKVVYFRGLLLCIMMLVLCIPLQAGQQSDNYQPSEGSMLRTGKKTSILPLKKTDVKITITGYVASVTVEQHFINPFRERIEAVYLFPLPSESAVDGMEIQLGARTIRGSVKERADAKKLYEEARDNGQSAALLEQERPNIFTASVANIDPGGKIRVRIHYTERLNYDDGGFRLMFPMVVAPRYIPILPDGSSVVKDADRITPPTMPDEMRAGNISIRVELESALPITEIKSPSHVIANDLLASEARDTHHRYLLKKAREIPNKDFVLEYKIAGEKPQAALMQAEHDTGDNFFLLMAAPPLNKDTETGPREMIYIIDVSGSMEGEKLKQAKKALLMCVRALKPQDYFNIIEFDSSFTPMVEKSLPFTPENLAITELYINNLVVKGGTEILSPLAHALKQPQLPSHGRVIVFFTDGQVGNEAQILQHVRVNLGNSRIFAFGIDTAVNEYFIKKLAQFGRGTAEFILPEQQNIEEIIKRFLKRIAAPLLTDLVIDWGEGNKPDFSPNPLPDLYLSQPVFISGRNKDYFSDDLTVRARQMTEMVKLPMLRQQMKYGPEHQRALATLWARGRIEQLTDKLIEKPDNEDLKKEIIELSIKYQLISPFTSFVCIEEQIIAQKRGKPKRVLVPVPLPSSWSAANNTQIAHLSGQGGASNLASGFIGPTAPQTMKISTGSANQPIPSNPISTPTTIAQSSSSITSGTVITAMTTKPAVVGNYPVTPSTGSTMPAKPTTPAVSPVTTTSKPDLSTNENLLRQLVITQQANGSWKGSNELETLRATALVTLSFISSGSNTQQGVFRSQVNRALKYLKENINSNGLLRGTNGQRRQTETQALVLWALCEDPTTSQHEPTLETAQKLLNGLIGLRAPQGIWLAHADGKESENATVWAALALNSARQIGLSVDDPFTDAANRLSGIDKLRLERALVLMLAGFDNLDLAGVAKLKQQLYKRNWQAPKARMEKALFAMIMLRKLDPSTAIGLKSKLQAIAPPAETMADKLAVRYLMLSLENSSLNAVR